MRIFAVAACANTFKITDDNARGNPRLLLWAMLRSARSCTLSDTCLEGVIGAANIAIAGTEIRRTTPCDGLWVALR